MQPLVDTGAGYNYIVGYIPRRWRRVLRFRKIPPEIVQFADSSDSRVTHVATVRVRLQGPNGTLVSRDIDLRRIQGGGATEMILGRSDLDSFGIWCSGSKVRCSDTLIFDADDALNPFSPLYPPSKNESIRIMRESPAHGSQDIIHSVATVAQDGAKVSDEREVSATPPVLSAADCDGDAPSTPHASIASKVGALPGLVNPEDLDVPTVKPTLPPKLEALCKQVMEDLVAKGWTKVPRCPGVQLRLRRTTKDDCLDTQDQVYVWECKLDAVPDTKRGRSYAQGLYSKLSPEHRAEHDRLAGVYQAKKWWWDSQTPPSTEPIVLGTAEVFLVCPSGPQKLRLVVDCRSLNRQLASASCDLPRTKEILAAIRINGGAATICTDVREAFYRIRFHKPYVLRLSMGSIDAAGNPAPKTVDSDRICFGAQFGPGVCGGALGPTLEHIMEKLESKNVLLATFVDDCPFNGPPEATTQACATALRGMGMQAFEVACKKFKPLSTERTHEVFRKCLDEHGITQPIVDNATLLGAGMKYAVDKQGRDVIRFSCNRQDRLSKARDGIDTALREECISKRQAFAISGQVGYDVLWLHARDRAWADALRSLIGSRLSACSWDHKVSFTEFCSQDRAALRYILNELRKCTEQTECHHDSFVIDHSNPDIPICLLLQGDASLSGGAYAIFLQNEDGSLTLLVADCWKWSALQTQYHSNRRELAVLLRGLQALSDVLERVCRSPEQQRESKCFVRFNTRPCEVVAESDNLPTVCWTRSRVMQQCDPIRSSKHLERRALSRLLTACHDEIEFLSTICSFSLRHIAGQENVFTDELSRILDVRVYDDESMAAILNKPVRLQPGGTTTSSQDPTSPTQDTPHDDVLIVREVVEWSLSNGIEPTWGISHYRDWTEKQGDPCDSLHFITTRQQGHPCNESISHSPTTTTDPLSTTSSPDTGTEHIPDWALDTYVEDPRPLFDKVLWIRKAARFHGKYTRAPRESEERPSDKSLVATLAEDSWDTHALHQKFYRLKLLMGFWRSKGNDPKTLQTKWHQTYDQNTCDAVVKCMQSYSSWCQSFIDNPDKVPHASPYQVSQGILYFKSHDPAGGQTPLYFIPSFEQSFCDLLVRTIHRKNLHCGCNATISGIMDSGYHFSSMRRCVRKLLSRCYQCAVRNARHHRHWHSAPNSELQDMSPSFLATKGAFYCAFCDYISVGRKRHVFYIYCVFTQYCYLLPTKAENEACTLIAIKRIQGMRPDMRIVLSDKAPYFRNQWPQIAREKTGLEWRLFPPRASWCASSGGRIQLEFLELFRTRVRVLNRYLERVADDEFADACLDVQCVLNNRPLGDCTHLEYENGSPTCLAITPRILADGHRGHDLPTPTQLGLGDVSNRIRSIRAVFKEQILRDLKNKSRSACARKAPKERYEDAFTPSSPVLVMRQSLGKHSYGSVLGFIIEDQGRGVYTVLTPQSRSDFVVQREHHYNLIPLSRVVHQLDPSFSRVVPFPSRVGQTISVKGRRGALNSALVVHHLKNGQVRAVFGGSAATRLCEYVNSSWQQV